MSQASVRRMLPASGIRAIVDRASAMERAGQAVLHLEIGRPDWRMPPGAAEAAKRAIDDGHVHYTANRGLPELRQAIADEVTAITGRHFDPDTELIVTSGVSEAWSMVGLALLGPGDEIIIPTPSWSHYWAVAEMAGATVVPLQLSPAQGFVIDPEELVRLITPRTRMMILTTPGNPTGAVQPPAVLQAIAELALKHGFFIFADEIYHEFVYDVEHVSIGRYLGDSELLLYANGFSKNFAMTGWRLGYIAAAAPLSDALNRVHQYLTVCTVTFAQKGAVSVLRHPERNAYTTEMRRAFRDRYAVWRDAFATCPSVQLVAPNGAIYIFPRIDHKGMTGAEFCEFMLTEHQVAMIPGHIFGTGFEQHVRIAYGRDVETQRAAAAKIVEVLKCR